MLTCVPARLQQCIRCCAGPLPVCWELIGLPHPAAFQRSSALQVHLSLDTVVVDEAGCVPESATPMLLRLRPANLVLIGDHKQLQAFTALVDPPRNHCRCGWLRAALCMVLQRVAEEVPSTRAAQAGTGIPAEYRWPAFA